MGKCLKKFLTHSAYESYIGGKPILPNVSICEDETNVVHYNPYVEPPIRALKFTATGASTLGLTNNGNAPVLEKSGDGKNWSSWDYSTINIADGESVYIRGNNPNGFSSSASKCSKFTMTGSISCEGNVMHLLSYEEDLTVIPCDYCYYSMFDGCTGLTTAPELPATTLATYCYRYMFRDCTSLTTAPELPATTLAGYCYYYMFKGCTNLTSAPELPATTCDSYCYYGMFLGCTSLTTAPELLPDTTLPPYCYSYMFQGCTSLTTAPELPATSLANYCYHSMFKGCTGLTTAPEWLPATTLATYCYQSMFQGCTSLTTAPELPATTLTTNCYYDMFRDCTSLNSITMLATNISATNCLPGWLDGVSSTGTFTKKSGVTIPSGTSGIPSGWTVVEI